MGLGAPRVCAEPSRFKSEDEGSKESRTVKEGAASSHLVTRVMSAGLSLFLPGLCVPGKSRKK